MIKGVYKFVGFGIVFLIFLMMVMSTLESHPNNKELEQPVLEIRKDFSNQIKIERWRYIDSIYKADERAYDKWMESQ